MNLKMSKASAGLLMIAIVVSVLMIPSLALEWSKYHKETHIMTVEGNYVDGEFFEMTEPVNATYYETALNIGTVRGSDASPNCAYFGYNMTAPAFLRRTVYYADWYAYIGDGNYTVEANYSVLPTAYTNEAVYYEYDATVDDFDCDFLRLTCDFDAAPHIQYYSGRLGAMYNMNIINTGVGEWIIIPSIIDRSEWDAEPDKVFYLVFDGIDFTDTDYQFKTEKFTLTGSDALTWDDEQVYVMVLLGCDMVLIIGFALTTDVIDIAIDRKRNKRGKWRR